VRPDYAVFAFEEIDEQLSRPPLAAVRALQAVGIAPKPEGWAAAPVSLRHALAVAGSQYTLDPPAIHALASQIPPRHVSLVGPRKEPDTRAVPGHVVRALATIQPLKDAQWQALHPFERFALETLAGNTRLLWRVLDEMATLPGHQLFGLTAGQDWVGPLARCDVQASTVAWSALAGKKVQEGRAVDLARATGRRVARRAPELFDVLADRTVGPVEIECTPNLAQGAMIWRAHVSSDTGEFLVDASLLAVAAAATALCGMLRALDPGVRMTAAAMKEEPWLGDAEGDESTQFFSNR
jgi:molybdenum cofactor biosynthesis enzyme